MKLYLKFVVKCLLSSHCFHCLGKFTKHFACIRGFAPELVPPVATALELLDLLDKDWFFPHAFAAQRQLSLVCAAISQ